MPSQELLQHVMSACHLYSQGGEGWAYRSRATFANNDPGKRKIALQRDSEDCCNHPGGDEHCHGIEDSHMVSVRARQTSKEEDD